MKILHGRLCLETFASVPTEKDIVLVIEGKIWKGRAMLGETIVNDDGLRHKIEYELLDVCI